MVLAAGQTRPVSEQTAAPSAGTFTVKLPITAGNETCVDDVFATTFNL